ncbi:MAG: glucose-1-phosphate adenylyltransferase subunit GlgD [Christensenellales bacterium]|jgi:glucose-1-phosphate adenylyltransferase
MIDNKFGVIYTGENAMSLKDLTYSRSVAAMPVGGRYRAIDFMVSNLVNSGIRNVGVITQKNYHSIMDHLGSGKEWDLSRKRDGLFMLPPYVTRENTGVYSGTVDALKGSMGFIRRSSQRYCIFMGSHTIYNMTFNDALEQHVQRGADITILYNVEPEKPKEAYVERLYLSMEASGRIVDMEINPYSPSTSNVSMDVYILEKTLLEHLVEECISRAKYDLIRDVLMAQIKDLKIMGCLYEGYVARIDTLGGYYKLNMDLLEKSTRDSLFSKDHPIYTKVKDEVPALYGSTGHTQNCIIADGCIIEGDVENSVLFRSVRVAPGAKIKNSIIMQACEIQDNAVLENVILDKAVLIKRERRLVGQPGFPVIIRKNSII